jgi:hypothetical protein
MSVSTSQPLRRFSREVVGSNRFAPTVSSRALRQQSAYRASTTPELYFLLSNIFNLDGADVRLAGIRGYD